MKFNLWQRQIVGHRPWEAPAFKRLLKQSHNRIGPERAFVLLNALEACLPIAGQVCECGVYQGASAYLMADLLTQKSPAKQLWLFDTFAGTPAGDTSDEVERQGLYRNTSAAAVKSTLEKISLTIEIVPGLLPASLTVLDQAQLCFAHLHLNLYRSTLETLEALWPALASQGMVVIEDYGIRNCGGVRKATEEFCTGRNLARLILPTGQALLIKR